MSFVHLHTHSHYTFQQALGTPEDIVKRAKELWQSAIALTDVANLHGAFDFYVAAKKSGIQPIIGVEFHISRKWRTNRDRDNDLYEIVLLAKNHRWYRNLIDLVTIAQKEGYYNGKVRIDWEILEQYRDNLIALSGSMYGEIPQHIITGREASFIRERIDYYEGVFWKENFYLEIEEHPDRSMQSRVNTELVRLSRQYWYNLVGTQNSYYIREEDAEIRDLIACVADGRALDDPDRPSLVGWDYSIRPSEEMEECFVYAEEAYTNTMKIAEMIDLTIEYGSYHIPKFPLSDEEQKEYTDYISYLFDNSFLKLSTEEWLLRKVCIEGLTYRYGFTLSKEEQTVMVHKLALKRPTKKLSDMLVDELYEISESYYSEEKKWIIAKLRESEKSIIRRLEYELTVVDIMGFNGYFCIVADFIRYAKNNTIPVWPWRGSAAWAILAYLSGITDIDPLRYWLLFERFLNPARVSMPDIDVDFSDTGRDEVLTYVRKKYGEDHVAQVCTFGTLAARAAVKDAGKAMWLWFVEMNALAKLIPGIPWMTLEKALRESPEFHTAYEENEKYKKIIDAAKKMEWTVRQLWVHACAVIIAPEPITHYCPLQPPPKDPTSTVTQFSAHPLEDLGLLKMDFLGLKNLTILARAQAIVKSIHGRDVDLLAIDYEDQEVLSLFWSGDTTWLFQFESAGMRKYLQQLKPTAFEDLIAMVSLYRPGPLPFIPDFIDRKHGRKIIEYPHPSLEAILKPTYGIAVYQEQIMQLVQAFAGFSLGEADILRRAIGKKKYDLLMEQRSKFLEAAERLGHPEKLAKYIFDEIIEPFAWYGFNKSHAACYAMIAYQTAYMKHYYPTEFMTAIMTSDEEDTERISLEIEEAEMQGIKVLPPDVNESMKHFTYIDAHSIRFWLKAIKWLGDWPITLLQNARKEKYFTDIPDFIERTGSDVINKKSLEALIYAGAMDGLWERASLIASIPKMTAYLKEIESKKETAQIWIFDLSWEETPHMTFSLEHGTPMTFEEKIKWEKATIGYPVSWHPLSGLEEYIEKKSKNLSLIREWKKKWKEKDTVPEIPLMGESDHEALWWSEIPHEEDGETIRRYDGDPLIVTEETWPIEEKKQNSGELPKVRLIGIVHDIRKMQTKKWGMMCSATVRSVGFDFRTVIFSRSYEALAGKIHMDEIVVCDGKIRFDESTWEITLMPDDIKSFTITQFHELMEKEYGANVDPSLSYQSEQKKNESTERYVIKVPAYWKKEDLLALRWFLEWEAVGTLSVWISIGGEEKDTKFSLASTRALEEWVSSR